MNNPIISSVPARLNLKNTVGKLASSLIPLALEHRSFIINHISPKVELVRNEDLLSYTISGVLLNVLMVSKEQCIHILYDESGETTIVQISSGGNGFYNNLSEKMGSLQQTAEKNGGSILLKYDSIKGTTVSFTFPEVSEAA